MNGKRYVGYSKNNLSERWAGHCEGASAYKRKKIEKAPHFHKAIAKWGKDAFTKEVLFFEETLAGAKETEILTILDRGPEYNKTYGGDGISGEALDNLIKRMKGNKYFEGKKHSPESILLMRESAVRSHKEKPRVYTDEWRSNIGKGHRGYQTEETKIKIGLSNKGRECPQKTRDAVGESNRRRKGEKRNQATKDLISLAQIKRFIDFPMTQDTKDKISAALTGRKANPEAGRKSGASRKGVKRGPYKMSPEGLEARRLSNEKRRGVKRGPYKKKLKGFTDG